MISVCIPAYNAAKFLPEALQSLITQTHPMWEVIVVEDGSDDGTEKLVDEFAASVVQNARYIRHPVNKGLSAARNSAIEAATGTHIALLDSDDIWRPNHLEDLLQVMTKTRTSLASAASEIFEDDTGNITEIRTPTVEEIANMPISLYKRNFMQPSAVLFLKSLYEKIGGFDESLKSCEDLDYWFKCLRHQAYFAFSGRATCRYRKHGATMTRNAFRMSYSLGEVRRKHLDWNAIPKRVKIQMTAHAFGSAGRIARKMDPNSALIAFRQALQLEPYRPQWILGYLICLFSTRYPTDKINYTI